MNFVVFLDELSRKSVTPLVGVGTREFQSGDRLKLYDKQYAVTFDGPARLATRVNQHGRNVPGATTRVVRVVDVARHLRPSPNISFTWPDECVADGKLPREGLLGGATIVCG